MKILVIGNEPIKEELCSNGKPDDFVWVNDIEQLKPNNADVVIDLDFENTPERIELLKASSSLVIINSVLHTLSETDASFVRINGWNTLLKSNVIEAASLNEAAKEKATIVFNQFGKTVRWVPDVVGLITPRVISSIINEAHYALAEGVSTKEEIDTAMKLGTNYPYGPFEWSEKIGVENCKALLQKLSEQQQRYQPVIK